MVLLRIVFPLNPCFVLWTSRSHKLPVGGKEEKILIYNQKELNKPMGILYAPLAFTRTATTAGRSPLPQGEGRERVIGPGVICASQIANSELIFPAPGQLWLK
ncbi:hypothetical protein F7P07_13925 [Klebsiella pneumoniae]|nr:hypothetical protein F7P07_13925 [Klebsiella pneumoniae]